jgi:hypothetical protein
LRKVDHLEKEGDAATYLGKNVIRVSGGCKVATTPGYVKKVLEGLGLELGSSAAPTPGQASPGYEPDECVLLDPVRRSTCRRAVGQLISLSEERPDLQHAVKRLAQTVQAPSELCWKALRRPARYLAGTACTELYYVPVCSAGSPALLLESWVDSDWGGCKPTRRSTSGGVLMLCGCRSLFLC